MTQVTFMQRAPKGAVFAPGCFDHQLGQRIPFNIGDETVLAELISVMVTPSGQGASITVEIPSSHPVFVNLPGHFSLYEEEHG
jgi:hypothetical protein